MFYHLFTLHDIYLGGGTGTITAFEHGQSVLRVVIAASLVCVMLGRRWALWAMWAGIGGLVASQIWAHVGGLPVAFTEGRHPLSYLKGLIFPTVITLAFTRAYRAAGEAS